MNIGKLGITAGNYERRCKHKHVSTGMELSEADYEAVFVESKEMKRLKKSAPEMLEALISIYVQFKSTGLNIYEVKVIIEKATGKSWEEIEELII